MQKTIELALNKFPVVPHSLRHHPASNITRNQVSVDLARLYHHYYLDSFGVAPPNPDPAQFEHIRLLLPTREFRVRDGGLGVAKTIRQHRSNELGQAFCRWFLYEHLNITYFAHMEHVLDRTLHPGFSGLRVERAQAGDAPDYFCAEDVTKIFLAEAKGRTTSISFRNAEFATWRKQFDQVIVKDVAGQPRGVKGFIVAARFVSEQNSPSLKSTLFVEDPETPGDRRLEEAPEFGAATIAVHYSGIAAKLRQPILSSALSSGSIVPDDIQFPVTIWEFQVPPLQGRRFVGGYFPSAEGVSAIEMKNGRWQFLSKDPLRLDVASGTFFGVDEKAFRTVVNMARGGDNLAAQVPLLPDIAAFYSGVSVLRDGSIIGPVEFFRPIEQLLL